MPRVTEQKKSRAGAERKCGRCGKVIEPGEQYLSWSFRYGGTHFRCLDHRPRPSELTQSKMAEVYAAIETAEDQLDGCGDVEDIKNLIEEVAEAARSVADEYREAAEPFGGAGENADRADELEGYADELESFDPEEGEVWSDEDHMDEARERAGEGAEPLDVIAALQEIRDEWEEDDHDADAVESAKDEARELLGGCPL